MLLISSSIDTHQSKQLVFLLTHTRKHSLYITNLVLLRTTCFTRQRVVGHLLKRMFRRSIMNHWYRHSKQTFRLLLHMVIQVSSDQTTPNSHNLHHKLIQAPTVEIHKYQDNLVLTIITITFNTAFHNQKQLCLLKRTMDLLLK